MNKRKIFFVLICGLVLGCLMAGAVMCIRKCTHKRKIGNQDAVYTYYGRTLSIKDFEQFDYNTTYEDMVMHLGEPNGWVGSGVVWPYYELADGRFAVCNCVRGGILSTNYCRWSRMHCPWIRGRKTVYGKNGFPRVTEFTDTEPENKEAGQL